MEKRIDFKIELPQDVIKINDIFKDNGFELYPIGGCVRDSFIRSKIKDWDLVTNALPDKVIELLKNQPFVTNILETGKAFGVINVITDNDEYEIATMRIDIGIGRRPESVEFTNIETDILRRDLTFNALYYDIEKSQIVDLVGGLDDLNNKITRTVGNPVDRFNEDKLRKLRILRFSARFEYKLDNDAKIALNLDNNLDGISPERIRDEFLKGIKTAKCVINFLDMLDDFNMFDWIFNKLSVKVLNFSEERNPVVLISTLLIGNNPMLVKNRLNSLKYTSEEISKIYFLISFNNFEPITIYYAKKSQMISNISNEEILRFAELNDMDMNLVNKFLDFKLTVTGADVEKLGIPPGPEMGVKIKELETQNFMNTLKLF